MIDRGAQVIKNAFPKKLIDRIPTPLTDAECHLAQSICGVLTPFRAATRLMESNKTGSLAH